MPRRAAKVDANQPAVVSALRKYGATVEHLHAVGKGCPDILVGYRGLNLLLEIKDGAKPMSAQALTMDQMNWHWDWRGQVGVVRSPEEAIEAVKYQWSKYVSEQEKAVKQ